MKKIASASKASIIAVLFLVFMLMLSGCSGETDNEVSEALGIDAVLEKDGEWLEDFEPFFRLDVDSATAWQAELENLRIFAPGMYELGEAKEKYQLDMDYQVFQPA